MGLVRNAEAKKNQGGSEGVIGSSSSTQSVKPINTDPTKEKVNEEESSGFATPTAKEARIPEPEQCPPAPRRPRRLVRNHVGVVEFFNPPDLETVFIQID